MKIKNILKLIVSLGATLSAGVIGSFFTVSSVSVWYTTLNKPALNPPAWVFGPVWTLLYILMGISLFLIWQKHSHILENVRMLQVWEIGIVVFLAQLFLNIIWSILFFGLENPGLALVDIIFLWLAILCTVFLFYKISRSAAYLLLPYLLWV